MSKAWLKSRKRDSYYRAAKRLSYRSRAAFKLLQTNDRFHLLRRGDRVLDLGASPGGWSQVASELVGERGVVFSIDMRPMKPIDGARFCQGDFTDRSFREELLRELGSRVDVIISDMAPRLSGNRSLDVSRCLDLCFKVAEFAQYSLRPGGRLLLKAFQGEGFTNLLTELRRTFLTVQAYTPEATPKGSAETYVIGIGFRSQARESADNLPVEPANARGERGLI